MNKRIDEIRERLDKVSDQDWSQLKHNTITLKNGSNKVLGYVDMHTSEGFELVINAASDIEYLLNYISNLENKVEIISLERGNK